MYVPFVLRRLAKTKSLRLVNLAGLSLLFACILISFAYVKGEFSYDRFYTNSDRIARLSIAFDGKQADGRVYGSFSNPMLKKCPEIEDVLKFSKILTTTLTHNNEKYVINDLLIGNKNFFSFFDILFLEGSLPSAFDSNGKIVISERLAMQLFGTTNVVGKKVGLGSRKYSLEASFISGVYKNIPDNSHFDTDLIICQDDVDDLYPYVYLLLRKGTDTEELARKITEMIGHIDDPNIKTGVAELMPLTDIHLHSRVLRELQPNGNMDDIYLMGGANVLLFIIVMFNLWLNSNVIFSYNKRYYQLLKLNGASSYEVIKDESRIALFIGLLALLFGKLISVFLSSYLGISFRFMSFLDEIGLFLFVLICAIVISLLPVIRSMAFTRFTNRNNDLRTTRFSFSNVKYMLVIQYVIVILIVIVAAGINSQMSIIKTTQVGARNDSIVVMKEQPQDVIDNFLLLKKELLKHPEIEMVTGAMQLPGDAVRDGVFIRTESNSEPLFCPVMIAGEDFFPFFDIKPIAGSLPPPLALTFQEETRLLDSMLSKKEINTLARDNYVINRKAMTLLGYSSPEDAIGKEISIQQGVIEYISSGTICGVVDDFVYNNVFEETTPMIIIQRNLFMNCFMLRLSPQYSDRALTVLSDVWKEVNPNYPLDYSFLKDSYRVVYRNEINAEKIIGLFSGLCLIVTMLGLIIFMAFMVETRTKEIGIRKVNGASGRDIIVMLSTSLLVWIVLAFVITVPIALYVLTKWLENFVYKTSLHWYIFAGAGLFVILISLIAISWQSLRAARIDPIDSIK